MPPGRASPMVLGVNAVEVLGLSGLDQELRRVEPLLVSVVAAGDPFLDQVATHLITAGGKRLRPMLALAAATRGERRASEADLLGSVSVELVHLASLYHDDVIDEATMRRGTESVNSRFGNLLAIVGGDYLLARSAEIAASLGTEIAGLLATTLGLLCRGQVSEVKTAFSVRRTVEQCLEAIEGKTAALMATSCRVGALTGGAPRSEVEALTEFGRNFGIVFQLRDDVLDVVATNGELGKPPARTWPKGSTPCRCCTRWPTPTSVRSWPACSASRWACPSGTRPGPWWRPPRASPPPWPWAASSPPEPTPRWTASRRRPWPARCGPSTTPCSTTCPKRPGPALCRGAPAARWGRRSPPGCWRCR